MVSAAAIRKIGKIWVLFAKHSKDSIALFRGQSLRIRSWLRRWLLGARRRGPFFLVEKVRISVSSPSREPPLPSAPAMKSLCSNSAAPIVAVRQAAAAETISRSELTISAFSRSWAAMRLITSSAVSPARENLTVIQGDVMVDEDVAEALRGSDAVVVSLGKTDGNPDDVVSRGTMNIINAMKQQNLERLIVVTSLGVGESKSQVPFLFKMLANTVMKAVMEDKERQEQLVRESGLRWTIVRPGGLADGPRTGRYQSGTEKTITAGRVNRADVADFILKELEAEAYVRQAPAVT